MITRPRYDRREKGLIIEREITAQLKTIGNAIHVDSDYDILFNKIGIEVKSSELCLNSGVISKDSKTRRYRVPFFEIEKENHKILIKNNGYYCFVITFKDKIILQRFYPAKEIIVSNNNKKYFYIHSEKLYDNNMLDFEEFKKRNVEIKN